jgi:hypothetical protein
MTVAQPVAPAAPTAGQVLRRGREVGLGAIGLARHAAVGVLTKVPGPRPASLPSNAELVPGAVVGAVIVTERVAAVVVDEVLSTAGAATRFVTRPSIVRWALRPAEDLLWRFHEIANRERERNEAAAAALLPSVIQQVTENVVTQIDFVSVIEQIPVDEIVAHLDIEAIVARIDLGGVIRESTAGLSAEVVEGVREQGMSLDSVAARVVDRVLRRRNPRQLELDARP